MRSRSCCEFVASPKFVHGVVSCALLALTVFAAVAGSYHALSLASDTPHIDDWHFISDLPKLTKHSPTHSYMLERHNGHPSVPARVAFLISAEYGNLHLQYLRYGTFFLSLTGFGLLVLLSARVRKALDAPYVVLFCIIAFCSLAVFSPNHWETYSLAMGITNMTTTVAVIGSVVAGYSWVCGKGIKYVLISFAAAILATLSMTQGMFVWSALAVLFWFGDASRKTLLTTLCCGVQILALFWNYFGHASAASASEYQVALKLSLMVPMLVSIPFFGMISNAPFVPLSVSSGAVICALCAVGLLSVSLASSDSRKSAAPFLALLCYGALAISLIALGRRDMPLELIAAPRYAALTMPFLIGAFGAIGLAAAKERMAAVALGAIFTLCLTGWLVGSQQEFALLEARRTTLSHIKEYLLSSSVNQRDDQSMREKLYINANTLEAARRSIAFMKEHQMSIFSVPATPEKTHSGYNAPMPVYSP